MMTEAEHKVCVVMEDSDFATYQSIAIPSHWLTVVAQGGKGAATHMNRMFDMFPDEPYYAYLADDVVPKSHEWDKKLAAAAMRAGYAYPNDGDFGITFAPHAFVKGDIVRAVGTLNPADFDHYGFDNFWFHLCRQAHRMVYCGDVMLEHKQDKKTIHPCGEADTSKWLAYKNAPEWASLVDRVRHA
jgi:hypothetical protein